ncbi:MAG TPA: hypothetical protein P5205_09475 [Candidatus Paceibacterota bacterium]|nr:hypothetical protein [Verrucomicrobiota bacterium]HSA10587.1 hypothetical protein [Candidatus Paceibacterota bacterium]
MKILLHSYVAARSLIARYLHAQTVLRAAEFETDVRTGVKADDLDVSGYDALVSHDVVPAAVRGALPGRVLGGRRWSRPEQLTWLAERDFPVMEWKLVGSQAEGLALFDTWGVDRLIVKRSYVDGGAGWHVLTRNQARYVTWDTAKDIVCREVNEDDGRVFKADLFAGRIMIGYVLKKAPLRDRLLANDETPDGYRRLAVYRDDRVAPDERHRGLVEFGEAEREELRRLSRELTQAGLGYVSVDLMRKPDGTLVAIELNTARVATWWTERFAFTRERFGEALVDLVRRF